MINKAFFLKEMGIHSWVPKESPAPNPIQSTNDTHTENTKMSTSKNDFPIWTIIHDIDASSSNMMKHVEAVLRNFGVQIQVLSFDSKNTNSTIQGQLLICMGEKSGSFYSGEMNPVENLREIIFETSNSENQDIPVIVTYSVRQLASFNKKIELWSDLIFARNIYLDTMSEGI